MSALSSFFTPLMTAYLYLTGAIIFEVIGTTLMAKSAEFTKLVPSVGMAVFYALSLYCLAKSIKIIPLGIAYALWGGVGIVLTTIIGMVIFKQSIDLPAIIGIAMIIAGVVVLNVFSQSVIH